MKAELGAVAAPTQTTATATKTILNELNDYINEYIYFGNESHYLLVSSWILSTYIYQSFDYTGYLFFHSNKPSSGKTRMLEILNLLASKSSGVLVSPTEAVLFRTAHEYTQILDEVDAYQNREALRGVLNAGYQKGGQVPRMAEQKKSDYSAVFFPVFAPRAFAGIGKTILDQTLRDRCFMIQMDRQTKEEKRKKLNKAAKIHAATLKKNIEVWIGQNKAAVSSIYEKDDFPYLEDFRDRTIDVTSPLASILEVAYKDHPHLDDARGGFLDAISTSREDQKDLQGELLLLNTLRQLSVDGSPITGNATELAELCATKEIDFNHYQISQILQRYGFKTKSVRKSGEDTPRYRYTLRPEDLEEVLSRYGR